MSAKLGYQNFIESLLTDEVCPKCKKWKLSRYKKAYWCNAQGCQYGVRATSGYKGAAHEIVEANINARKFYDRDYKRAAEEDFAEDK